MVAAGNDQDLALLLDEKDAVIQQLKKELQSAVWKHTKEGLRSIVLAVQKQRSLDTRTLGQLPEAVKTNAACLLWVTGNCVPLPTHERDKAWEGAFSAWLTANEAVTQQIVMHVAEAADTFGHPVDVADTWDALAVLRQAVRLPLLQQRWHLLCQVLQISSCDLVA